MSNSGPFRLATGGLIDRCRPLEFRFNGKKLSGYVGDTVASALLANGIRTVARSFKYHRPRGIFSAGVEEPNALVQLRAGAHVVPSARATLAKLQSGLDVQSHSGWPSTQFDLLRLFDLVKPIFAAGFYNRTFMWPSWRYYESTIRRMSGFGCAPKSRDSSRYQLQNIHCDVVIVGGGESGLRAALDAGRAGVRVLLVEQNDTLGGRLRWSASHIDGKQANSWINGVTAELEHYPDVRILLRTAAVSIHEHDVLTLVEQLSDEAGSLIGERYWVVRTKRTVLATGAIEQPLIFDNNDRPGVMLAGSARKYLHCYGIAPGRRVLVATNNTSAYDTVFDLAAAGVNVFAVLDSRAVVPRSFVVELQQKGIGLYPSTMPIDTNGFGGLKEVTVGRLSDDEMTVRDTWKIAADAVLVSGGWSPTLHLLAQARGKLQYCEELGALEASTIPDNFELRGRAAGSRSGNACVIGPRVSPVGQTTCQWVDLRHDVVVSDLELAYRENFRAIEHVKRYTTVGMSADQGKTSNSAALQIIARIADKKASDLGHTTYRPPFTPVTLGAIAGRDVGELYSPARYSPLHSWHVSHGADIENYGEWRRPAAYLRDGEKRADAIQREARAIRSGVGIFDSSSLGKIEIHGPDALEFLDRFYINNLLTLQPGKIRYGLMLRENGSIFDDGTAVLLRPNHLLITTTSGGATRVGAWLEEWRQCEWPNLRVSITPVTEQWATMAITGMNSRTLLQRLHPDFSISNEAFPHLAMREGRLLGQPVRIYRVSFSGELTYEINVPASASIELWETLIHAGKYADITAYGLEALMLMRLEKGFLHVGSDTDGTTLPDDVGWGNVATSKRTHYIGKRSLSLPHSLCSSRRQLVGLIGRVGEVLTAGHHLRIIDERLGQAAVKCRLPSDGWITSAGLNFSDSSPIALAMLAAGRSMFGRDVDVYDNGHIVARAKVVSPPFFDPSGARMNA